MLQQITPVNLVTGIHYSKKGKNMEYGPRSEFALTIMRDKYAHTKSDGTKETWAEICRRVVTNVMAASPARDDKDLQDAIYKLMLERKFIPGGRYLYAAGNRLHQVQNCLLLSAEDSREGWSDLLYKSSMALMTGAGIGVEYSAIRAKGSLIQRTGGVATGPIALMSMLNEVGRGIVQGGNRRSAIWAGLNWKHADSEDFIRIKDWSPAVRAMKAQDALAPAPLDGTNVSVGLDDLFFAALADINHPLHSRATDIFWQTTNRMLRTAEPGFSINLGASSNEILRNAPICAGTHVLTIEGYKDVYYLVNKSNTVWTGSQWVKDVIFKQTNAAADTVRVKFTGNREIKCDVSHPFLVDRYTQSQSGCSKGKLIFDRTERVPAGKLKPGDILHVSLPHLETLPGRDVAAYALGYTYGDGTFSHSGSAEITFCTAESKHCADLIQTLPNVGKVVETDSRGFTRLYFHTNKNYWSNRHKSVFPTELFSASPSVQASFIAGLFDADGNAEATQNRLRLASVHPGFLRGVALLLEQLGILASVIKAGRSTYGQSQVYCLNVMADYIRTFDEVIPTVRVNLTGVRKYIPLRRSRLKVKSVIKSDPEAVYCADVKVAEHSFQAEGIIISNCTELVSADDSDICNIGSINMERIESLAEMKEVVQLATTFLLAGTLYSDVPYAKVAEVRTQNRRLGLGLMGLHAWLLMHEKSYGSDSELEEYLKIYRDESSVTSQKMADAWDISRPIKTRAIAPNGTIGIVSETTTGIEPIFCTAFKRRYYQYGKVNYQYVIDPIAQKLVESGIQVDKIEDAYSLANNVEQRVSFQAWVQQYVDHAISSTINLPAWGSAQNNPDTVKPFGEMLLKYLPNLRGITVYPDGARNGQPLEAVPYNEAIKHIGQVFVEQADMCDITKGGSCGA